MYVGMSFQEGATTSRMSLTLCQTPFFFSKSVNVLLADEQRKPEKRGRVPISQKTHLSTSHIHTVKDRKRERERERERERRSSEGMTTHLLWAPLPSDNKGGRRFPTATTRHARGWPGAGCLCRDRCGPEAQPEGSAPRTRCWVAF